MKTGRKLHQVEFMGILVSSARIVSILGISSKEEAPKSFTVPDSTEVVRLFPRDPRLLFPSRTPPTLPTSLKGDHFRDTFVLTSFDYIRRNYRLVHSTFFQRDSAV